jgi:threonine dehydratase
VNILELAHQRIFTNLPVKGLSLDVECETRDEEHLDRLIAALRAASYEVSPIEVA